VFDPASQGGIQNFSVVKGVFVYTSGLIGREDPDDVTIETPVGSIGIRGTIIAADVDAGEITVVEGAIVLRDLGGSEMTLATQFETGRFNAGQGIENLGQKSAADVIQKFSIVSNVAPALFSSINDAAAEASETAPKDTQQETPATEQPQNEQSFDADGKTDQDGDNEVDGTIIEGTQNAPAESSGEPTNAATADTKALSETTQQEMQPSQTMMSSQMTNALGLEETGMSMGVDTTPPDAIPQQQQTVDRARNIRDSGNANNVSIAPTEFFASSEEYTWNYNFDKEFTGEATSYELSTGTISHLESLQTEGIISGAGWNFNTASGNLIINFSNDFNTGTANGLTDGTSSTFQIDVTALNADGQQSVGGFANYDFTLYNDGTGTLLTANIVNFDDSAVIQRAVAGNQDTDLKIGTTAASNNNTIFLGDGNDVAQIGLGNTSIDNTIYLGNGNNQAVTISATGSIDNTVIGGDDKDTFNLQEVQGKFYGMDGNDQFSISIADTNTVNKLETLSQDIVIDGGHSNFRAANFLETGNYSGPAGIGDSLILNGSGSLDFTAVNDSFVKGIEILMSDGGNANVTLSYEDVIQMTDGRNTLLIRGDANDTFDFSDLAGRRFTLDENDILIDDNITRTTTTADDTAFDVYSNGDVTLIIDSDVGLATAIV